MTSSLKAGKGNVCPKKPETVKKKIKKPSTIKSTIGLGYSVECNLKKRLNNKDTVQSHQ